MSRTGEIVGAFVRRIADIDGADWNACFSGEAEDYAYYRACEQASEGTGHVSAVVALRGSQCLAVAPVFSTVFRLDSSFQAGAGRFAQARRSLARWLAWPVIGLGSPLAERCHVGFRPGLTMADRVSAWGALIDAVEHQASAERTSLIAVKDVIAPFDPAIGSVLARRGYARLAGLPVARLDLSGVSNLEAYFSRLTPATRKDLRRKLRSAATVRVEDCHDIAPYVGEITRLYESTRAESALDYGEFEKLPPDYFSRVSEALRARALFKLYWVGTELAAFNLLLIEPDRIIDKFLGMRYPLARDHNLYALSWIENVRHCLAHGIRELQTGQTAYREKMRMGSHLVPSSIWFRHRGAVANRVLRTFAPLASFERNDPQLATACTRRTA